MELRGLHSSDRHTHGLESAREPPPVPGGLGQPAQETQWRKALYVEPRGRAGLVQALRFGAEARGSCTLADRSGELLTSPTCASEHKQKRRRDASAFCMSRSSPGVATGSRGMRGRRQIAANSGPFSQHTAMLKLL